ncbi:biotin-dependent carboxyltransferase family protein [Xylophilus sp. GW821-FHT01B05]
MSTLEVVKPGLLSSFQDLGRTGLQSLGVPVCGAMDALSHRLANLLVGNDENQATLEITLMGPTLRFGRDSVLALAGADLSATLQLPGADPAAPGTPLPLLQAIQVPAGALLQFGRRRNGLRAYLALAGGFGLTPVMGSCSTYLRGSLGGWQGRALRKGDLLPLPASAPTPGAASAEAVAAQLQAVTGAAAGAPIRIIEGPEWAQFTTQAQQDFLATPYRVGAQSDRMGYRLEGAVLPRHVKRDMLSEAVAFGTVQVPPDGQPIVLMADRQTSGGYPRIAQVASVDLPRLAQVMPGESLHFERIPLERAQVLLLQRQDILMALSSSTRRTEPACKST